LRMLIKSGVTLEGLILAVWVVQLLVYYLLILARRNGRSLFLMVWQRLLMFLMQRVRCERLVVHLRRILGVTGLEGLMMLRLLLRGLV
jgi:hypothetical protein